MQGRFLRQSDLVIVIGVVDALIGAVALVVNHLWVPALIVLFLSLGAIFVYGATSTERRRISALWLLMFAVALFPLGTILLIRPPHATVNDSVLMTDAAASRLLAGLNPYGNDYLHSAARAFYIPEVPVNFGLSHYVYPPGPILADALLQILHRIGGPDLDFGWLYLIALFFLFWAAWFLGIKKKESQAAILLFCLFPPLLFDYLDLINDVFFMAPLVFSLAFLRRERPLLAGLFFGISLCFKQEAVLLLPFLLLVGYRQHAWSGILKAGAAASLVCIAVVGPFLLWSPRAMVNDLAGFFYSSGVANYPIRGFGLSGILLNLGLVSNRWEAFPSAWFQIFISLPLLGVLLYFLNRHFSWPRLYVYVGIFSLSVFFFGRVLAPNYLDFSLLWLGLALALVLPEELSTQTNSRAEGSASQISPGATAT